MKEWHYLKDDDYPNCDGVYLVATKQSNGKYAYYTTLYIESPMCKNVWKTKYDGWAEIIPFIS